MDKNSTSRLSERLNRALFFFVAILLHLIIFLMVVGYVVFPSHPAKDTDFHAAYLPSAPPVPPPAPVDTHAILFSGPDVTPLISTPADGSHVNITPGDLGGGTDLGPSSLPARDLGVPNNAGDPLKLAPRVDLLGVKEMHDKWDPQHTGRLRFPIYLAKYADGDWDCNHYFHGSDLTSGCLPNLLAKVDEWSHGDLKGKEIKVVALDSSELIENPPPFVFFTGHKDFVLTRAEIDNLRKYLQNGGCIWGDSALAGDGSRFDVAFHREMKRVLPDADLNFAPLPLDHDIFTHSRFPMDAMPKGMNERSDPMESIDLGGKLAIIYTPNDYSDMMTLLLQPGLEERSAQMAPEDHWTAEHPLFTPGNFVYHQASYFRNYMPGSAMTSYKLSMNILVHLLHRYDEELLLTP